MKIAIYSTASAKNDCYKPLPFQTAASREGYRRAFATNRSDALPPPQLPAVLLLGVAAERERGGLGLPGSGSLFALVPAGHLQLDGSRGVPPLPSPCPSLQHLRQEIPAQAQPGRMG